MLFKVLKSFVKKQISQAEKDLLKEPLNSVDCTEEEVYINVNLYDLIQKKLSQLTSGGGK